MFKNTRERFDNFKTEHNDDYQIILHVIVKPIFAVAVTASVVAAAVAAADAIDARIPAEDE